MAISIRDLGAAITRNVGVPPLCIIQARLASTRLPNKMLLPFGGETLIARGYRIACEAFGRDNVVVAIPFADSISPLADELDSLDARMIAWNGDDADVLGRFHHVAHRFRWHPDSVIVRYTPDDSFKTVDGLRRVAAGERLPVEIGGEAFTLAQLDEALYLIPPMSDSSARWREHITHALFEVAPPSCPPGCWTIDTAEDYEAALARLEAEATGVERSLWDESVGV